MPSLKETAAAHRAARGLSPDERHYVAATLWSWWSGNAPNRCNLAYFSGAKHQAVNRIVDEGSKIYPELIKATAETARARIDRWREERSRPRLELSAGGPRFHVPEYDSWGQRKADKVVYGAIERPFSHGQRIDWIPYLARTQRWDATHFTIARGVIRDAPRNRVDVPEWLADAVRNWERIERTKGLVPTAYERQRARKAAGLIKAKRKAAAR